MRVHAVECDLPPDCSCLPSVMTVSTVTVMTGDTPRRTVRIPDDLWIAVAARAAANGESVTDVIRRAMRTYLCDTCEMPDGDHDLDCPNHEWNRWKLPHDYDPDRRAFLKPCRCGRSQFDEIHRKSGDEA